MARDKTNTGHRDHRGRTVWSGPRGGWFVEHQGRRIQVDKRRFQNTSVSEGPLPQLPPDVIRHISRLHPRAGARLAVAGDRNAAAEARRHADAARRVGRAWRAKTDDLSRVRTILADIMKTRALHTALFDRSAAERALQAAGFRVTPERSASKMYFGGFVARIRSDDFGQVVHLIKYSVRADDGRLGAYRWSMTLEASNDRTRRVVLSPIPPELAESRPAPPEVLRYAEELLPYLFA